MDQEFEELKKLALDNQKAIQENRENINKNFEKIQANSYGLEILRDYKNTSKRLYLLVILLIVAIIILGLHHLV